MLAEKRRFFAYQALAACALLQFVPNWMVLLCGWGLGVYGASELAARGARHYGAAVVFGGASMVLTIAGPVLTGMTGPSAGLVVLLSLFELAKLLCALLFTVLVCLGLCAQFRAAGYGGRIEWALLVLFSAGYLLALCVMVGVTLEWVNGLTAGFAVNVVNVVTILASVALIADLFRAQKRLTGE